MLSIGLAGAERLKERRPLRFRQTGPGNTDMGACHRAPQLLKGRGIIAIPIRSGDGIYLPSSGVSTPLPTAKAGEGATLNNMATIAYARGNYITTIEYLEQSLTIQQDIGDKAGEGVTRNNISQIYYARGDYETALKYLEQSLTIQQDIGNKAGIIPALHNMANIALEAKDLKKGKEYLSQALSLAMEIKDAMGLFHVAGQMGSIYAKKGNKEEARELLTLAIQVGRKAGFPDVDQFEEVLAKV